MIIWVYDELYSFYFENMWLILCISYLQAWKFRLLADNLWPIDDVVCDVNITFIEGRGLDLDEIYLPHLH